MAFAHEQVCRVAGVHGDPAALGGAVTVALCGHWDHSGPCRWPHHTASEVTGRADDTAEVLVTVSFDAPPDEEGHVRRLIDSALSTGQQTGPDGAITTWDPAIRGSAG